MTTIACEVNTQELIEYYQGALEFFKGNEKICKILNCLINDLIIS